METLAMTTEFWGAFWTTLATVVLLVAPVVMYAYFVSDHWIGDADTYDRVMATVASRDSRAEAFQAVDQAPSRHAA
jgi:hypothetical protein